MIKNVLICGIGAIGSIYADKIQQYSPNNLKILVDEGRLKRYLKHPNIFNGKELRFEYVLPDEKNFKADLIIIATKYDGLNDAIKNIKNFVSENTIIVSLLNGITSEKIIAEKYGCDKLVYSYFIGHSAVRTGQNITQDGVNKIVFGSFQKEENVKILKEYFEKVGINYEIPKDILYSIWLKFMLNVSSNQVSAILGYTFGEILNNKKCMKFIENIMKEVQEIAKAEGIKETDKMVDDALRYIKTMSPKGKTSMLQDIENRRKTEVDMFAGTIIDLGKKHKISTPYNLVLKSLINSIEASIA